MSQLTVYILCACLLVCSLGSETCVRKALNTLAESALASVDSERVRRRRRPREEGLRRDIMLINSGTRHLITLLWAH